MAKNRLANEKSPYLLQHAENPVDWYSWGEEAFEKAEKEDKPVLLSIGYATCHWCHVMAHESFEDEEVAELMNDAFVNIKVDREERPDIDNTYMTICQMITGSGGWPLTIFMTPDKRPFYAATYIPKRGRHGRPGMVELIPWIQRLWDQEREKIYDSATEIVGAFRKSNNLTAGSAVSKDTLTKAYEQFTRQYDGEYGGFGSQPKFPSPHNLIFLLRYWRQNGDDRALEMVEKTLTRMRLGGLYDQIGFGFHRYSTDRRWLLPHFEKMLYDQAMMMMAYTEAWQATGNRLFEQTVEEITAYLFRDMSDDRGGFYSAEDADSEGEEGKFYVWSVEAIRSLLPADEADLCIDVYNLEKDGNFEEEATQQKTGQNIPHLKKTTEELAAERNLDARELNNKLQSIRNTLLLEREQRVRPLLDDKILTDWNGLIIAALARAGNIFGKQPLIDRAEQTAGFIFSELQNADGTLLHRYRQGEAAIEGHADDYSFFIWALLELYEATFNAEYLTRALELNSVFTEHCWDERHGAFYFTAEGSEEVLGRKKEGYDGAIPSGNSVAMMNLLRLGRITADPKLEEQAERIGALFSEQIERAPTGFGQMLQGISFGQGPSYEIVIAGRKESEGTRKLLDELNQHFIPNKIVLLRVPGDDRIGDLAPYTKHQVMHDDKATAYVCRNYRCEQPVTSHERFAALLESE